MSDQPDRRTLAAGRLATVGGLIGVVAGIVQAGIGSRIPDWTGGKDNPIALGLLTVALSASVVAAAHPLRTLAARSTGTLTAAALWFATVAMVCFTTVGRIWYLPGLLILSAAGFTVAASGWRNTRTVIAERWMHGLLAMLGGLELLMTAGAAPVATIATGTIAGVALIAAAIIGSPGRRRRVLLLVAATLPFVALTWWTIITPLITVAAFVIGVAVTKAARPRNAAVHATHPRSQTIGVS